MLQYLENNGHRFKYSEVSKELTANEDSNDLLLGRVKMAYDLPSGVVVKLIFKETKYNTIKPFTIFLKGSGYFSVPSVLFNELTTESDLSNLDVTLTFIGQKIIKIND